MEMVHQNMHVLVTGAFGRVGTAIIEHLQHQYSFTFLDADPNPDYEAISADILDLEILVEAFDGMDAIVHLAGDPSVDAHWMSVLENNIIGTYNCLEAARKTDVDRFVFASSNHVVGMYENEHSPDIYREDYDFVIDHESAPRPDSLYASSKIFGEALGRQYVEANDALRDFYALRIGSVRESEYDHPYGDAEKGVENGAWNRGSRQYKSALERLSATWLSRRDMAHLVECCLETPDVGFEIFYGVSDNPTRWFDIDHARAVVGYHPDDNSARYDSAPR